MTATYQSISDLRARFEYASQLAALHFQRCQTNDTGRPCARCDELDGDAADAEDALHAAREQGGRIT